MPGRETRRLRHLADASRRQTGWGRGWLSSWRSSATFRSAFRPGGWARVASAKYRATVEAPCRSRHVTVLDRAEPSAAPGRVRDRRFRLAPGNELAQVECVGFARQNHNYVRSPRPADALIAAMRVRLSISSSPVSESSLGTKVAGARQGGGDQDAGQQVAGVRRDRGHARRMMTGRLRTAHPRGRIREGAAGPAGATVFR